MRGPGAVVLALFTSLSHTSRACARGMHAECPDPLRCACDCHDPAVGERR